MTKLLTAIKNEQAAYQKLTVIQVIQSKLQLFGLFVIFTALYVMQTRYSDENSVRLSVRLSVCLAHAWIVTKRKKDLSRFLYRTKDNLA